MLARATLRRGAALAALAAIAGLLLGFGCFLSYGLVLMAPIAAAVLIVAYRLAGRPLRAGAPVAGPLVVALLSAMLGVAAVVAGFAAGGFWWPEGYHLVVQRYYQGIAAERPYAYWLWASLACLMVSAGPACVPALRRAVAAGLASPLLLPAAAAVAVLLADLSGLSKGEVERIWLPFAVWLTAGCAALPAAGRRPACLAGRACGHGTADQPPPAHHLVAPALSPPQKGSPVGHGS